MTTFTAAIDIDAPPDAVWTVLADTASWPAFDPYCERIEGTAGFGEKLTVFTPLAPGRGITVTVSKFDAPTTFAWTVSLPLGVFKSVRTHTISARHGGSRLELNEVLSGPMLKAILASLPDLNEPFAAFCAGLKARVEAGAGA